MISRHIQVDSGLGGGCLWGWIGTGGSENTSDPVFLNTARLKHSQESNEGGIQPHPPLPHVCLASSSPSRNLTLNQRIKVSGSGTGRGSGVWQGTDPGASPVIAHKSTYYLCTLRSPLTRARGGFPSVVIDAWGTSGVRTDHSGDCGPSEWPFSWGTSSFKDDPREFRSRGFLGVFEGRRNSQIWAKCKHQPSSP